MPATSGSHSTTRQNKLLISDDGERSGPAEEAKQINKNFNLNKSMQSNTKDTCIERFLVFMSLFFVIILFPISLFTVFVAVRQFERAIILRNGKVRKNKAFGPGLVYFLPCVDTVKYTDLRIMCYAVPPQEALTKDSLTVSVDAVVYYKIWDPVWAVLNVADYRIATQFLAATTLRNALGNRKLAEILTDRPAVSNQVFQQMNNLTGDWGVKIVRVEVKDISLPLQLQKAMATEAESSRLANAKIIVAKSEIEATKNLQKATKMLMDNPLCMQLRYLQTLQTISSEKTHTIVMPFSSEIISRLFK
ncbi:band 7 protein AGAP004871-like isoform X1 [Trichoplusia ni]|uniref:Band 7 protein AGAP004871-like isoform X1 n=3 Tax=Trichoplusia ni TaxID=7111 RepID=A0A7E5WH05_TRINI|nr:band 7 protein AGAP004871-like isoform X1 [Trichoplusia ni]